MKDYPNFLKSFSSRTESVLEKSKLLIAFKKAMNPKELLRIIKSFNLTVEVDDNKQENQHWIQVNNTNKRFWLKTTDGSPITHKVYQKLEEKMKEMISWIGPVYRDTMAKGPYSYYCPLPNVLLVRKSKAGNFENLNEEFGLKENEKKSKYLTAFDYMEIKNTKKGNAYSLRENLEKLVGDVFFENMPMYKPQCTTIPNDTLYGSQWNMTQINAPDGWDISTGVNTTVICVLDEGCDLTHPDLQFSEQGINLGTMMPTGAPTGNHGTACAGIAAATFNNNLGVSGVAGNCSIMPVAFQNWTDVEVANGINYATTHGADVISMSFGWDPWNPMIIDPEILTAFNNNVVMCVATHNYNSAITYPATNPLVMAIGASSLDDNRKSPLSPDGELWGSDFGDLMYGGVLTGVSVVAPGVQIPTTDIQGNNGYNTTTGVNGNYFMMFNGTSSATPHVAGLAALLKSQYPGLTNVQARNIIERTAAKVGTLPFTEMSGFLNGTRNQEMGYGRIDVMRALDFADIMIKDWSGDDGTEPSACPGGNFWTYSDIVVRITDDNVFNPSNPGQSKHVERGQTNYIYVQVTNNGPQVARNVSVNLRITPYVGLQFVYPQDWTLTDSMHVNPTSIVNNFPTVASGATVMAKFSISSAQVEDLYGWQNSHPWHPCLLSQVLTDNDYMYGSSDLSFGNIVVRKNNFAQRNLSVIDVLAGASPAFGFVVGSLFKKQKMVKLSIDKSGFPKNSKVRFKLDENEKIFPKLDFENYSNEETDSYLKFMDRSKVQTRMGGQYSEITFEKGSKIKLICGRRKELQIKEIGEGELFTKNGLNFIDLRSEKGFISFDTKENPLFPLSAEVQIPRDAQRGDEFTLIVSQLNEKNEILGGATVIYRVK